MYRTRVRSESAEGIYYLVNGWNKYNAFWYKDSDIEKHPYLKERTFFKSSSSIDTDSVIKLQEYNERRDQA